MSRSRCRCGHLVPRARRWRFGITTVYHFLLVPLTIGLAFYVALFQTRWHRTGEERWVQATKLWGKLMPERLAEPSHAHPACRPRADS